MDFVSCSCWFPFREFIICIWSTYIMRNIPHLKSHVKNMKSTMKVSYFRDELTLSLSHSSWEHYQLNTTLSKFIVWRSLDYPRQYTSGLQIPGSLLIPTNLWGEPYVFCLIWLTFSIESPIFEEFCL